MDTVEARVSEEATKPANLKKHLQDRATELEKEL